MSKYIRIGEVKIPLDVYATSGTAILGIRASGKTVTAKGIFEQLHQHGIPPIVFDAIGVWRHLKTPAPGKDGKGFRVVVAGGREPDVPLTPESAPELVRAAIRCNIPLIIDLYDRHLSKADWRKIVQSCFRVLLYDNEGVRHVFLEEAAEYAPQKIMDGQTYAEVEKLMRMGGNASVGITLINQRSQEVNKAILDLCENLVLMRQRGAHAIDALSKWIDKLDPKSAAAIAKGMPTMEPGECWVFTGDVDVATHTRAEMPRSYHPDRRNPETGKVRPSTDVGDFIASMRATLPKLREEMDARDPETLHRRIEELERQVKAKVPTGSREDAATIKRQRGAIEALMKFVIQINALEFSKDAGVDRAELEQAISAAVTRAMGLIEASVSTRAAAFVALQREGQRLIGKIEKLTQDEEMEIAVEVKRNEPFTVRAQPTRDRPPPTEGNGNYPPSVRNILDQIHRAYPVGLTFAAAAARAGVSKKSSAYRSYRKLVEHSQEVLSDQDGKMRSAPGYEMRDAVNVRDSREAWMGRLPPTYGRMLGVIWDHGPIDRAEIARQAAVSPTSSGLNAGLKELKSLGLVEYQDGEYRLAAGLS